MKQQDLINRLRDELTPVIAQTEGNSAMGLTDHNKIAENLTCGLMREILGFRGLRNLNATEHANYPAIDLADFGARIAVQVTATATLAKIKARSVNSSSRACRHRSIVSWCTSWRASRTHTAKDRSTRSRGRRWPSTAGGHPRFQGSA